jgi:hypothetical protein
MRTFESTKSRAWRRIRTAVLAIAAVVVVAAHTPYAAPAPDRPLSKCSDYGCEQ